MMFAHVNVWLTHARAGDAAVATRACDGCGTCKCATDAAACATVAARATVAACATVAAYGARATVTVCTTVAACGACATVAAYAMCVTSTARNTSLLFLPAKMRCYTRFMKRPSRVSTCTVSPTSIYIGT